MQNYITYHESVKEAIALALIQIMETKILSDITILEIVNKAGVSRSSFYRNFDDKEDVINYYIDFLFDESKKEENPYSPHHLKAFLIEKFSSAISKSGRTQLGL
ncbi:MAG: TetR/AcrR family transcriptional regulator, partial [Coprobacillus sp.]|nr:TetR/AcrR family transcriptional regulator [Coprobacillus sp.]